MRKKILVFVIILILVIVWYKVPQYKYRTFEGVLFQLGEENAHRVEVEIKGIVQRYFFSQMTFEGTIKINDQLMPPPESAEKNLRIKLGGGLINQSIQYWPTPDIKGMRHDYGYLATNHNFSKIIIAV